MSQVYNADFLNIYDAQCTLREAKTVLGVFHIVSTPSVFGNMSKA